VESLNATSAQLMALNKALDGLWLRNEVISNNVANADTPGFKASKVSFEDALKSALDNGSFLEDVQPQIVTQRNTSMRMDGNNVDIDSEMSDLAKTTIAYNAAIQKLAVEFQMLRSAINGGK